MVGYLFAGQGSQYIGMGKGLYEASLEAKNIFDKADKVLGFSLSKLCFQGPQEELTKTLNCQPAILTASIAAWEAFKSYEKIDNANSYCAGLSLGEYSALVAAEVLSFEDAVYLVRCRGRFMEEEAAKKPGKMASIIGMSLDDTRKLCSDMGVEVANINSPGQIVISGDVKKIEEAAKVAAERGAKRAIILEVSGAFHSSFMKEASVKLAKELENIKINKPKINFLSNVTARPTDSIQEIKDNLIKQVYSSVLWEGSMNFILSKGVSNFFEFGPGKVLKGLMRRISDKAQVTVIEKEEDLLNRRQNAS